jgi:hypothetical protein
MYQRRHQLISRQLLFHDDNGGTEDQRGKNLSLLESNREPSEQVVALFGAVAVLFCNPKLYGMGEMRSAWVERGIVYLVLVEVGLD